MLHTSHLFQSVRLRRIGQALVHASFQPSAVVITAKGGSSGLSNLKRYFFIV